MTVQELIDKLQDIQDKTRVVYIDDPRGGFFPAHPEIEEYQDGRSEYKQDIIVLSMERWWLKD